MQYIQALASPCRCSERWLRQRRWRRRWWWCHCWWWRRWPTFHTPICMGTNPAQTSTTHGAHHKYKSGTRTSHIWTQARITHATRYAFECATIADVETHIYTIICHDAWQCRAQHKRHRWWDRLLSYLCALFRIGNYVSTFIRAYNANICTIARIV